MSDSCLVEILKESRPVFSGAVVKLSVDTVELPNGKQATREVVRHCGAVCVLAVNADDKVVLVKQFRHPVGDVLLEIPAGKMDMDGESPEQCAYRELAEETPYTAQSMRLIQKFYTAPGFCDELMYLYEAMGITENSELETDEDEFVQTVLLSRQEVRQAIQDRSIQDAKTLIALQNWLLN
ncbi:NUDIX hydrolase [Advenella sp. RU8]|uniref:NUDIX hydrolase n=1 Tax=Advenella sp. RU8 TaxID=3399575 RepID=UPI003AAD7562